MTAFEIVKQIWEAILNQRIKDALVLFARLIIWIDENRTDSGGVMAAVAEDPEQDKVFDTLCDNITGVIAPEGVAAALPNRRDKRRERLARIVKWGLEYFAKYAERYLDDLFKLPATEQSNENETCGADDSAAASDDSTE